MYAHRFYTETDYQVIHYFNGGERVLPPDQHDYLAWAAENTPAIEAVGRFLGVVDGKLVVDPNKDAILAAEAAARAEAEIKANLREIDMASIRSLREYVAAQPGAPKFVVDYEVAAQTERKKL